MNELTDESRMSLAILFKEIIQNNPPLNNLSLYGFSKNKDVNRSEGEIILEAILNLSISTIQNLNLG